MLPPVFFSINLIDRGLLLPDLVDQFAETALAVSRIATLEGGTSTSLEEAGTSLKYRLVDGDVVSTHLPLLQKLYKEDFLAIAEQVFGVRLQISPNVISGANVNILSASGQRYEWHYDSNPYTGLLILSDANEQTGGRLMFGRGAGQVALSLSRGDLLFFDARRTAHAVEPLVSEWVRLSVPMNYFPAGQPVERPEDLDRTLYR